MRELRKLGQGHGFGEATHPVVGGVHAQNSGGARSEGVLVVARTRSVRSSHLDHASAGKAHHVRHSKRAAYLHELSTRDDHLTSFTECGQRQQHSGRVVVDCERGLRAEERGQQRGDEVVALSSLARLEVQLEIAVRRGGAQGLDGSSRKRRPAEICVQDHAARIDDAPQAWRGAGTQPLLNAVSASVVAGNLAALTLGLHLVADRAHDQPTTELRHQRGIRRLVDQRPDTRQGARPLKFGIPYPAHCPNEIRLAGV